MERLGVREAKEHFSEVLNNLENSGPVLITKSGFPTAIISPITDDELDAFVMQHSKAIHEVLAEGAENIRKSKSRPARDVMREIRKSRGS